MILLELSGSKADLDGLFFEILLLSRLAFLHYQETATACVECSMIKERQAEGIAAAIDKGVKFGAPSKLNPEQVAALKARVAQGGDKSKIAKEFGISRPTLYKLVA